MASLSDGSPSCAGPPGRLIISSQPTAGCETEEGDDGRRHRNRGAILRVTADGGPGTALEARVRHHRRHWRNHRHRGRRLCLLLARLHRRRQHRVCHHARRRSRPRQPAAPSSRRGGAGRHPGPHRQADPLCDQQPPPSRPHLREPGVPSRWGRARVQLLHGAHDRLQRLLVPDVPLGCLGRAPAARLRRAPRHLRAVPRAVAGQDGRAAVRVRRQHHSGRGVAGHDHGLVSPGQGCCTWAT